MGWLCSCTIAPCAHTHTHTRTHLRTHTNAATGMSARTMHTSGVRGLMRPCPHPPSPRLCRWWSRWCSPPLSTCGSSTRWPPAPSCSTSTWCTCWGTRSRCGWAAAGPAAAAATAGGAVLWLCRCWSSSVVLTQRDTRLSALMPAQSGAAVCACACCSLAAMPQLHQAPHSPLLLSTPQGVAGSSTGSLCSLGSGSAGSGTLTHTRTHARTHAHAHIHTHTHVRTPGGGQERHGQPVQPRQPCMQRDSHQRDCSKHRLQPCQHIPAQEPHDEQEQQPELLMGEQHRWGRVGRPDHLGCPGLQALVRPPLASSISLCHDVPPTRIPTTADPPYPHARMGIGAAARKGGACSPS